VKCYENNYYKPTIVQRRASVFKGTTTTIKGQMTAIFDTVKIFRIQ